MKINELYIENIIENSTDSQNQYVALMKTLHRNGAKLINPYTTDKEGSMIANFEGDWSVYQDKPFKKFFNFVPGDVIAVQYYKKEYAFFILYPYEAKILNFTSDTVDVSIDELVKKPVKFSYEILDQYDKEELLFHKLGHIELDDNDWISPIYGTIQPANYGESRHGKKVEYYKMCFKGKDISYVVAEPDEIINLKSFKSQGVLSFICDLQKAFLNNTDIEQEMYNLNDFNNSDYDLGWQDVLGLVDNARKYAATKNNSISDILKYIVFKLNSTDISPAKVYSFDIEVSRILAYYYTPETWSAAYLIMGGCSDDAFLNFRLWLILQGTSIEKTLIHFQGLDLIKPGLTLDQLADILPENFDPEEIDEAYQLYGIGQRVLQSRPDKDNLPKFGRKPEYTPEPNIDEELKQYDFEDEKQMRKLYPKLYKRFVDEQ
jgi:hypothetical protein